MYGEVIELWFQGEKIRLWVSGTPTMSKLDYKKKALEILISDAQSQLNACI